MSAATEPVDDGARPMADAPPPPADAPTGLLARVVAAAASRLGFGRASSSSDGDESGREAGGSDGEREGEFFVFACAMFVSARIGVWTRAACLCAPAVVALPNRNTEAHYGSVVLGGVGRWARAA